MSSDLVNWSSATTTQSLDLGLTGTLTYQEAASTAAKFFRLKSWLQEYVPRNQCIDWNLILH